MPELETVVIEPKTQATASVIWMHGLGANAHDFESIVPHLGLPADHGIRFIFPNAPIRPITINAGVPMRGWYDITGFDLTSREDAEGIAKSTDQINELIEHEMAQGIASDNVILAGFSQGGAVALYAGLTAAKKLGGILALSTYLPLREQIFSQLHAANENIPIMMAHGTMDPVVQFEWGEQSRAALENAGYSISWHSYPIVHCVCEQEIEVIGEWLSQVCA